VVRGIGGKALAWVAAHATARLARASAGVTSGDRPSRVAPTRSRRLACTARLYSPWRSGASIPGLDLDPRAIPGPHYELGANQGLQGRQPRLIHPAEDLKPRGDPPLEHDLAPGETDPHRRPLDAPRPAEAVVESGQDPILVPDDGPGPIHAAVGPSLVLTGHAASGSAPTSWFTRSKKCTSTSGSAW